MIHAFAVEPEVAARWGRRDEFRFIHDKFGLGTPRVLLELPEFTDWKNAVYSAASELELTPQDWKRLEEVFRIFSEHRCRRASATYVSELSWLENAEHEHARRDFRAIVAGENPRGNSAVILREDLGLPKAKLWACVNGATAARTPEDMASELSAMLLNCRELHLIDPHFGPENARHRRMLEALIKVLSSNGISPDVIRVHSSKKAELAFFEAEATRMAARLPAGISVEFRRWGERTGGEKLHNRYVLTDLGGVSLGVGLDAGATGQTDDILLLPRAQFEHRWDQYVSNNGAFDLIDAPATVRGPCPPARARGGR